MYNPKLGIFQSHDPLGYIDSMNMYACCGNNPTNYVDPWGLWARFGKRPLTGAPWFGVFSNNPLDDWANTELSHEQIWFDDGTNLGWFDDSKVRPDSQARKKYCGWRDGLYDEEIIKKAIRNLLKDKKFDGIPEYLPSTYTPFGNYIPSRYISDYNLLNNNCQHFCEAVREEYRRLGGEVIYKVE